MSGYTSWAVNSAPAEIGLEATIGSGSIQLIGLYEGTEDEFNGVISGLLHNIGLSYQSDVQSYDWVDALIWLGGLGTLSTAGAADSVRFFYLPSPIHAFDLHAFSQHDTFLAKSLTTPMSAPLNSETYTALGNYLLNNSTTSAYASSLSWFLQFELYGGANSAINNLSSDATAYPFRDSLFVLQLYASSSNYQPPYPETDGEAFLQGIVDVIEGEMLVSAGTSPEEFGAYTNYIDPTLEGWQDAYYKGNYARLEELQKVGLFSLLLLLVLVTDRCLT